ncbi:MAG: hypothetical protein RLZZ210_277 [Pseudomonadota bacterium]|jgi:tRNA 2-thiouridine synthesizing protein A
MDNFNINVDEELDVTGLSCPKPLLHTKKKLATMEAEKILKVMLDDRKSLEDFAFFCTATGHTLIKVINEKKPMILYIKVKSN